MYPVLSDIFKDLLGISFPIPIYSFGAMMAVAFLVGGKLASIEVDRLYKAGRLKGVRVPAPEKKGSNKKKGKKRGGTVEASPSVLIGTLVIIAVVSGISGSKLFHILENFGAFMRDPLGQIFSTGGLTFFGGLLVAFLSLAWYIGKKGLSRPTFADAGLPPVFLAYGIGRIGCHLAGDGDWGIPANLSAQPSWIPDWLWAETYPNNILGVSLPETGVYPTSVYEFGMCLVLFGILWSLRKHPFKSGWLFSLTLIFFGVERFLIEQIRVNEKFDLFGMDVTQAEVISVLLIIVGAVGLARTTKRREDKAPKDRQARVPSPAA